MDVVWFKGGSRAVDHTPQPRPSFSAQVTLPQARAVAQWHWLYCCQYTLLRKAATRRSCSDASPPLKAPVSRPCADQLKSWELGRTH